MGSLQVCGLLVNQLWLKMFLNHLELSRSKIDTVIASDSFYSYPSPLCLLFPSNLILQIGVCVIFSSRPEYIVMYQTYMVTPVFSTYRIIIKSMNFGSSLKGF
jgi:hypothetical protein